MIRIAVAEVLEAYRTTKALPIQGVWRAPDFCLCPLAVVAYARGAWSPSVDDEDEGAHEYECAIRDALGLDPIYLHGYVMGFDGVKPEECSRWSQHDVWQAGYQDGAEANREVFNRLWGRPRKIKRDWAPAKKIPEPVNVSGDDDIPF